MSGTELDPDGTDSYHPEHPFEQVGDPHYLAPEVRTRLNWPPVAAAPHGPAEARYWGTLPYEAEEPPGPSMPAHSGECTVRRGESFSHDTCGCSCHEGPKS